MANRAYTSGLELLANNALDWSSDDVRVLLVDNAGSYTFDPDHDAVSDIGAHELSGTGYGRIALANTSTNVDLANDRVDFLADPVTFEDLDAGEPQAIVVYLHTGADDANNVLISYHDGGFPRMSNGEDFTINWAGDSNNRVLRMSSPAN